MVSNVDETFPVDGVKASKATARAQALIIKTELEELQRKVRIAWLIARGDLSV